MPYARTMFRSACLLLLCLGVREKASATTFTDTFPINIENQVVETIFNVATASPYSLYTTSYGGGVNLNGTTSLAGGFVPVLSLFNADGTIVAADGASGMCGGTAKIDAATKMCDDA